MRVPDRVLGCSQVGYLTTHDVLVKSVAFLQPYVLSIVYDFAGVLATICLSVGTDHW